MGISHVVVLLYFFIFLIKLAFLLASDSATVFTPPPETAVEMKRKDSVVFKPGIAVTVGVITVIFSFTFLLLLYVKHCKRSDSNGFSIGDSRTYPPVTGRKNSGVNRVVIESLPIFRFESLKGQKDGLDCAVCLNRFEPIDVLRLLPKCKHAFHVECVDTWLEAHSTCPLCRYRVDPEDILLVVEEDNRQSQNASRIPSTQQSPKEVRGVSRVSGRHSFAGGGNSIDVIVEKPRIDPITFNPRRSLDSWSFKKKKNTESVTIGCFDNRPRKDGLLLAEKANSSTHGSAGIEQRRLEHRIIVSGAPETEKPGLHNHRWSDVHPSDLLFLQSETILSDTDSRRFMKTRTLTFPASSGGGRDGDGGGRINESGKDVIKGRSMSEITGMGRFRSNEEQQREYEQRQQERKRQAGAVSRWLAWISQYNNNSQTNHN